MLEKYPKIYQLFDFLMDFDFTFFFEKSSETSSALRLFSQNPKFQIDLCKSTILSASHLAVCPGCGIVVGAVYLLVRARRERRPALRGGSLDCARQRSSPDVRKHWQNEHHVNIGEHTHPHNVNA